MIAKVRLIAALLDKDGKRIKNVCMETTPMHAADKLNDFTGWVNRNILEIDFHVTGIDTEPKGGKGNG